ncbi:hypothetical protein [Corynebacterium lizhenjunii]|uniref:hypothetical protein n=1 Tax=Corynebacterium lizhenjunii TaxID=2709394 RepID=UPI0013E9B17F|nr:hypothetical protein [Corynebacterium lizhenjunii]
MEPRASSSLHRHLPDPTRIEPTLAAVQRAWEGQPELSLPTLFAQLANEGIGWGSSDEQLVAALNQRAAVRPGHFPLADAPSTARFLFSCGQVRITVDCEWVVVRTPGRQPVVWRYARVRPTGPGRPLVVADTEGFEHRFGVIDSITRIDPDGEVVRRGLQGLKRSHLGDVVWVLRLDDNRVAICGHTLRVFTVHRREVSVQELRWERVLHGGAVGEELTLAQPGGRQVTIGTVTGLWLADAPAG